MDLLQPVVFDSGTGVFKAGFAGETVPKTTFPSLVGRPKHVRVMAQALEGDTFVGAKAQEHRALLKLKYPMAHGVVEDWEDMELIWKHAYEELKIHSEEHPLLITEAPLNPRRNRERAGEILFETFNVPALFVSMQAVLSLYASGRTTGVVLDSGDGVTHAVPVYEGFALPHSITRVDLAGRDVTEHLQLLLRRAGYKFTTSAEKEIVRTVKETATYVALNPAAEEKAYAQKKALEDGAADDGDRYVLPDGTVMHLGAERFRAPEILFQPDLVGMECPSVPQVLVNAISKTDLDMRKSLYSQIVLSGGSTTFRGYGERLLSEVKALAPPEIKIRIAAPPERMLSTWIGGSILASLATFKRMWVSADDYANEGARALHRAL